LNNSIIKDLSIQISLSGLSFCILNRTSKHLEFIDTQRFVKKENHFEVLEHLKKKLSAHPELNQSFSSVFVIYQNELSNLVPKELFDENSIADYLKFNSKILKSDYISFDEIPANASVNVYVPYMNINNFIFETFGTFEYKHASTILIDTILQKEPETIGERIYLNVNTQDFELIVLNDKKLILYNSFEYISKEDLIYYLLFSMEQLNLNPETVPLNLMGMIAKEDEVYAIIYKYVRFVEFYKPSYTFEFKPGLKTFHLHENAIILNSF